MRWVDAEETKTSITATPKQGFTCTFSCKLPPPRPHTQWHARLKLHIGNEAQKLQLRHGEQLELEAATGKRGSATYTIRRCSLSAWAFTVPSNLPKLHETGEAKSKHYWRFENPYSSVNWRLNHQNNKWNLSSKIYYYYFHLLFRWRSHGFFYLQCCDTIHAHWQSSTLHKRNVSQIWLKVRRDESKKIEELCYI